ncbi:MAG: SPOR domain-containing protein [Deinococcales bacterium]
MKRFAPLVTSLLAPSLLAPSLLALGLLSLGLAQQLNQGNVITPNSISMQPNATYTANYPAQQPSYNQPGYNQTSSYQTGYNQTGYNQTGYNQAGYNQTSNQAGYTGNQAGYTGATTSTPTISASPDLANSLAQFQYMLSLLEQRIASLESQNGQLQQRLTQLETKVNSGGSTGGTSTGGSTGGTNTGGSLSPNVSYYLQVGAFGRSDLASQQKLRLQQFGYNVYESYDGRFTRLYVGPYPGSQVASIQSQLLSQGYSSFPVQ